jgi:thioredoxin-related protein
MKSFLVPVIALFIAVFLFASCEKEYKTPEDIESTVAFLDARSALPVFPFGTNMIYVFVNADWCKYSQAMKDRIFSRPEIIEYMNTHFTCISLMPDSVTKIQFMGEEVTRQQLMNALQLKKYPGHYFFSPDGELKGVRDGYIDLRLFKQLLKYMAEGHVNKYNFKTFQSKPESFVDTIYGEF